MVGHGWRVISAGRAGGRGGGGSESESARMSRAGVRNLKGLLAWVLCSDAILSPMRARRGDGLGMWCVEETVTRCSKRV